MRRKKESKRPFVAGFAITVIVLFSILVGLLYIRPGITVNNLPTSIPQYSPLWGKFVPDGFLLFGFENYTAIRHYNSSYPTQYKTLLDIIDLNVSLKPAVISSVLTISFSAPNESVAFAFVNPGAFENFSSAFARVNDSGIRVGGDTMYFVRNSAQGSIQFGWIALIPADRGIAFATGTSDAKQAIQRCLQVNTGDAFVSNLNVRRMLYVANDSINHLAIGVQGFAGVIPLANSTMTVVDASHSQVVVRRILEFNSTSTALSQYNNVKQGYLASRQFDVYDSFVRTTEFRAISDVTGAVRLVE